MGQQTGRADSDAESPEAVEERGIPAEAVATPEQSDLEVVIENDPDQLYDTSGSAQRVIDEELTVVKQNRVMEE